MPKTLLSNILILIVLIFAASVPAIFACSCNRPPTLPDEFEGSSIVAVMKLASLELGTESTGSRSMVGYPVAAKMIVEKVFKGNVKAGDELSFREGGGGDCIWRFEEKSVGGRFLFYLTAPTIGRPYGNPENNDNRSMYNGFTCGRSGPVERDTVGRDVVFLNDLKKLSGRSRVSGKFIAEFDAGNPIVTDLKIKFVGAAGVFETKTAKSGYYEIYDLPAGDYSMEFTPPAGWRVSEQYLSYMQDFTVPSTANRFGTIHEIPISVKNGGHVDLDLAFERIGAISGRVISPDGAPMKGISVRAVPFSSITDWEKAWPIRTQREGEFSFRNLNPGEYVLVVSNNGRLSSRHPFGTIFYPGTTDMQNAARIKVSGTVENLVIQIPSVIKLADVDGRFIFSDGKSLPGTWVGFTPDEPEKYEREEAITDNEGNFRLRIPAGASGKLVGQTFVYPKDATCPKQKELIEAAGGITVKVTSKEFKILAGGSKTPVDLELPFPSCEKPK